MIRRRTLAATAVALAAPVSLRAATATTLRFIPQIDLAFLDPHWVTANITRNFGQMVYDTLYGYDLRYQPHPQMLEGHQIEDDGRTWRLVLRPGQAWHDGTPVLARDCVASIIRWGRRDPFGGQLLRTTDVLDAPDDRTVRFRLKKPFPLLPYALGKVASYMPAMMPERLALTDPAAQVAEVVGSGPFRYLADERVPGAHNAYARFDAYQPRPDGPLEWYAGPKVAHFDRVVWTTIPDAATASAALQAGEQDWLEQTVPDLIPSLARTRGITTEVLDSSGAIGMLRPNFLHPPFNNAAFRRALRGAFNQAEFMQAVVGDDPALYHVPTGFFTPGTPMASGAGLDQLAPQDPAAVRAAIAASGYTGEPVLLMVPTDYQSMRQMGEVAADAMRRVGVTVDFAALDWGSMLARRNNRGPVGAGGWSAFITSWTGSDWLNPATHVSLRGQGEAGYAGWFTDPVLEAQYQAWFDAPDEATRQAVCVAMQREAVAEVPYYPLGQFSQGTAYRGIAGVLKGGFPTFWNVRPA